MSDGNAPSETDTSANADGDSPASAGIGVSGDAKPDKGSETSLRQRMLSVLQWAVAIGAFWYVARDVDWAATASDFAALSPAVVTAILLVTMLEFGSRFGTWYVLLNGRADISFVTTAHVDLVIKFVNHIIPSKASGHSIAPLVLRHYTDIEWSKAVSVAGVNTGLYATLYAIVSLSGVAYFAGMTGRLRGGWVVVILLSTVVYLTAGAMILLAGRRMDTAGRLFGGLESIGSQVPRIGDRLADIAGAVPSFTSDSAGTFRNLTGQPGVVLPYALLWAGTLMIFPGTRVWLFLTSLGGSFSPVVLLPVALVMSYSVTVLPLTPGGVGVAEASATAVLVGLGVAPELAAVVVLVDRTLGVYLPALLGWIPIARIDLSGLLARGG